MDAPMVSPRILVLIGVLFTSSSAILIRLSDAPPLATAAYRMLFSALLVLPPFIRREHAGGSSSTEPELSGIAVQDLLLCVASGLFLAVHFALWITSLSYTTVASATVLVSTHPIFILIASVVFLRERPDRLTIILVAVAFAGSVLLGMNVGGTGNGSPLGNWLAFGGGAAVSGYFLIGRAVRGRIGATHYTFIVYLTSALFLIIACVVGGVPLTGFPVRDYLIFSALAVFPTLMGHSIFNWSLRYLRPTFVSVAVLGEPIFATILAVFIFSEVPSLVTAAGGIVIIGAIAWYLYHEEITNRQKP